jgi:hypothetical protein
MRHQLNIMLLAVTALIVEAVPALAQERPRKPTAYSAPACSDGKGLVLCLEDRSSDAARKLKDRRTQSRSALQKFARLAGMFMGRVDAAQVGDFKLRFTLELKPGRDDF